MAPKQGKDLLPAVLFCPANLDLIRKGSKALVKCAVDMAGMLSLYQGLCTDLNALSAPAQTDQDTGKPADQSTEMSADQNTEKRIEESKILAVDDVTRLLRSSASFRAVRDSASKVLVNYLSVADKSASLGNVSSLCLFPQPGAKWTWTHDVALVLGTLRHGFAQYKALAADEELECFILSASRHDRNFLCRRVAEQLRDFSFSVPTGLSCDAKLHGTQKPQPTSEQCDMSNANKDREIASVAEIPTVQPETLPWLQRWSKKQLNKRIRRLIM